MQQVDAFCETVMKPFTLHHIILPMRNFLINNSLTAIELRFSISINEEKLLLS